MQHMGPNHTLGCKTWLFGRHAAPTRPVPPTHRDHLLAGCPALRLHPAAPAAGLANTNLFDVATSNGATVWDTSYLNPPPLGSSAKLPCYKAGSPVGAYLGGDAAYMMNAWGNGRLAGARLPACLLGCSALRFSATAAALRCSASSSHCGGSGGSGGDALVHCMVCATAAQFQHAAPPALLIAASHPTCCLAAPLQARARLWPASLGSRAPAVLRAPSGRLI